MEKAIWISPPSGRAKDKNLYFRARRTFDLNAIPKEAQLEIAAESLYMTWVNGHFAGSGPVRGSRSLNFYDSLDIRQYLRPGRNVIGILVQCMNIPNFLSFPSGGALLAELDGVVWTGDGGWAVQLADREWPQDVEVFTLQTGFMEWRDFRHEPQGWLDGLATGVWTKPDELGTPERGIPGKCLLPRPIPELAISARRPSSILLVALNEPAPPSSKDQNVAELMTTEKHLPPPPGLFREAQALLGSGELIVKPQSEGHSVSIILGFSEEVIGFFKAEVSGPEGTIVDLGYDEELEDGRLHAFRACYHMADRYVLPAGRSVEVGSGLHERGFRIVEIALRNFSSPVSIRAVRAVDRRYPVSRRGEFFCSDALLNRIWDVCVETVSTCTTDVFTDCPWRERSFWVNDLLVENASWLKAFGDSRLNARALRLALSNVREDGWLPGVCPDSGVIGLVLFPTNLFIPLILKDYLLHSGDTKLVEELLPSALKLIALVDSCEDGSGLVKPPQEFWNFYDWSYPINNLGLEKNRSALLEWLRCISLSDAAWLAERIGDNTLASRLRARIPDIAERTLRFFWPEGSVAASDWIEDDGTPSALRSQLSHALALLSGTLSEERRKVAVEAIDDVSFFEPELYLHCFVLQAMLGAGMASAAIRRIRQHWGKIVETGTPTLWETGIHAPLGKTAFENAGSLCHGFGSAPISVFQCGILGVTPIEPGFRKFSFAPNFCGLRFARGRVPTPFGDIRVKLTEHHLAEIEIPEGILGLTPDGSVLAPGIHNLILKHSK